MQRNTALLTERPFDVLIIGGGAFGAAAAHDAALRGLSTALIERNDFGAGASAECFKMVHGGIRYLQHADFRRLRHSCRERSALLRIAPHLVSPLPIAIPTYGHGRSGKMFLGAGATVYDLLTLDRNADIPDPEQRIGRTRFLSRAELLRLFPHLDDPGLTGAVVFQDGQMYNPARVVLAFVKSAVQSGAVASNYVEATDFIWRGDRVCGVRARDRLTGDAFDIRAQLVLNAAGPWAEYLFHDAVRFGQWRRRPFSRDAYFIVDRPPISPYALAVQGLSIDKDARFGRSRRHLFSVPWRNRTLLGVWHRLHRDYPDTARVAPEEIETWMQELNAVYPQLELSPSEVTFAHCGLVPFGDTATEHELSFGKESQFIDHRRTHRVGGLVTVIGIRFTTARGDAAHALDLLLEQWPGSVASAHTERRPLVGGNIHNFAAFGREAEQFRPRDIPQASFQSLLRNHGTQYREVIDIHERESTFRGLIAGTDTLSAEVAFAVRHEMAMRLEDVVMRRTDIAAGAHPGREAIREAARAMAALCRWSRQREASEIDATETVLAAHRALPPHGEPAAGVHAGSAVNA
jgi:glycerol-3-phosphate dehydrogenase